jgi:Zn-dependent protease
VAPSQDHPVPEELAPYVLAWRTAALRDREVIDALVHPAEAAPSAGLAAALERWGGSYYWSDEPGGRWLVLTVPRPRRPERWWLHALLFGLTIVTTTLAGGVLQGTVDVDGTWGLLRGRIAFVGVPWHALAGGLAFSLPLVAILLAHELGHYVTARRYHLDVSPPYFLPVPLWPSLIGTMGAFIRLRTLLSDRRQLFDVGAAGPFAGFIVAVPVLLIGMWLSRDLPALPGAATGMLLVLGPDRADQLLIGDSPITLLARWVTHGHLGPILLSPLAFAGVIGMLVTMINLMPMAQLDGGHVLYAAAPRWHQRVATLFWIAVLALGYRWMGWYIWAGLVLLLSRGRLDHPTVLEPGRPLPASRGPLAWAIAVVFLLTFAPVPFRT